jgi:putative ABC transport system ATP-binding protein
MLEIVNLSKSFSDGNKRNVVLDNISFSVLYQDFTVVMGKSGSGKSTLLFSVSLLDSIDNGQISLDGIRLADFGFVFQNNNLIEIMTLFENVALPAIGQKCFARENVTKIMVSLGLERCRNKLPNLCPRQWGSMTSRMQTDCQWRYRSLELSSSLTS